MVVYQLGLLIGSRVTILPPFDVPVEIQIHLVQDLVVVNHFSLILLILFAVKHLLFVVNNLYEESTLIIPFYSSLLILGWNRGREMLFYSVCCFSILLCNMFCMKTHFYLCFF